MEAESSVRKPEATTSMHDVAAAASQALRRSPSKMGRRTSSFVGGTAIEEEPTETVHITSMQREHSRTIFADYDKPRVWRQRPIHHRRASQPAGNSILNHRGPAGVSSEDGSTTALEDETSSQSTDEDGMAKAHADLAYLDLSISMPYAVLHMRDSLLAYTSQLEERMRSLYPFPTPSAEAPQTDSSSLPAIFHTQIEALKEELRALINALPTPSAPFSPQRATAVFAAGRQSLAHDWDRLLAMRPDIVLSLPKAQERARALASDLPGAIVPLSDLKLTLANALPSSQNAVLASIQRRFETVQEAVRAMTLRDLFFSAKTEEARLKLQTSSTPARRARSGSFAASQQALTRQFESIFDTVKSKGEDFRTAGQATATSMVKAARNAEERMYTKAVELARNGQMLLQYEHLPDLWRNNEHILSGYRFIPKEEWLSLLKSTFQIHNETGNIMTHLVGALIVIPLFWPSKERFDEQTTPMDRMVQTIYLIAAIKCLLLSVSWHVMAGCSDACLFERFACVDYTGIAWLVAASVWTLVYNAFYCQPNLAMVYSLSTLLVGLVGAIVPWAAWFNERQNKPIRIAVFLAMCFTGLAPFTHALLSHGAYKTIGFFGAIVPSCAAYVTGLLFYAFQFPECRYPGRFDVIGHAHQIWHISIVVAILLHYRATFFWHENRFNFSCSASLPQTRPLLSNPFAVDLNLADEAVHSWRIVAGRIGDGLVGRIWDKAVEALMTTFST